MITEEDAGLIALGCNGARFADYAARALLADRRLAANVRDNTALFDVLRSRLVCQDRIGARRLLIDWTDESAKQVCQVSRFDPGAHYYALGTKFGTYEEACEHIRLSGGRVGTTIVHRTPREGD